MLTACKWCVSRRVKGAFVFLHHAFLTFFPHSIHLRLSIPCIHSVAFVRRIWLIPSIFQLFWFPFIPGVFTISYVVFRSFLVFLQWSLVRFLLTPGIFNIFDTVFHWFLVFFLHSTYRFNLVISIFPNSFVRSFRVILQRFLLRFLLIPGIFSFILGIFQQSSLSNFAHSWCFLVSFISIIFRAFPPSIPAHLWYFRYILYFFVQFWYFARTLWLLKYVIELTAKNNY